jgi:protein-S-isoprenylcysteine O-methyltransferase Ste14
MTPADRVAGTAAGIVITGWIAFVIVMARRPKPPGAEGPARRDRWSMLWIAIIAVLVVGGITLLNAAVQRLGRQWSLVARVASGHDLVTTGPYGHVRHPIYTAMLIMLIATGLAISGPARLAVAVAVFTLGTALRVRAEETLLRAAFGSTFDAYAKRVPAVVPRPGSHRV